MRSPNLNFNLYLYLNLNSVLVLLLILPRHPGKHCCYLLSAVLLGKKNGCFSNSCFSQIGPWLNGGPISSYELPPEAGLSVSPPGQVIQPRQLERHHENN